MYIREPVGSLCNMRLINHKREITIMVSSIPNNSNNWGKQEEIGEPDLGPKSCTEMIYARSVSLPSLLTVSSG
jgi:hypothetical protein